MHCSPTMADLAALETSARNDLHAAADEPALRAWHGKYFGKQGEVLAALKAIGTIPPAERRTYGQEANRIKEALTRDYEAALTRAKQRALEKNLSADALDVTLPGR